MTVSTLEILPSGTLRVEGADLRMIAALGKRLGRPSTSKYLVFNEITFKSKKLLKKALNKAGYKDAVIEDNADAKHLYGYHGDQRPETANIIIRRGNTGVGSSNDIGFLKTKNGYVPIVSEYDRGAVLGGKFLPTVNGHYNELVANEVAYELGGNVEERVVKDNHVRLTVRY